LKYIASQNLVQQSMPAWQPQQPQLWWWFPGQDQEAMAWMNNQPTVKQPKIENPLSEAQKENKLLQVNWMQSI
jgi:hypothetical protein